MLNLLYSTLLPLPLPQSKRTIHLLVVVMTRHDDHRTCGGWGGGGKLMGLTNSLPLDDLIKYTHPPWHNTDKHRPVINKRIQCL